MIQKLIDRVFGSKNERALKRIQPLVAAVAEKAPTYSKLSDDELRRQTAVFREKLDQGAEVDDIMLDAFAAIREASSRVLNMRHFDCQIVGGIVLHRGQIAEMKTGEGKTLVATLPCYLNGLTGKGVHVITVNDYLARRDSEWMGTLYEWMGLTCGVVGSDMGYAARKKSYDSDITYGTNNEFGFDYLRDNMKYSSDDFVQRGHHHAVVDEVDSILIDEARTPLIISGPAEEATDKYFTADDLVRKLRKDLDFKVNEESHSVTLSEEGIEKVESLLKIDNIYDPRHIEMLHCVQQALRANALYHRDKDYVINEGQVVIVDEFTGRLMPGRRWSDGLHQAVEAKERVKIERENQTLATVTLQNYFRMYDKLSGMTGTAETEEKEFRQIYGLDVVVIPTNRQLQRIEYPDVVFRTAAEKWGAIIDEIEEIHAENRPILVGTTSIENSEMLASRLKRKGIKHVVLNAKHHGREAEIVAQAGRRAMVTVATNMAGRGTDILLGGSPEFYAGPLLEAAGLSRYEGDGAEFLRRMLRGDTAGAAEVAARQEGITPELTARIAEIRDQCRSEHDEVVEAGGLHVIGTERHEARRIDNQLRGRAGRQGDPGSSRFFLSLQDDLMRIFASDRMSDLMKRLGMEEGVPIESPLVTRAIGNAQSKVEANNYGIRKNLIEYDDVMNEQRKEMYSLRQEVLRGEGVLEMVERIAQDLAATLAARTAPEKTDEQDWDVDELLQQLRHYFGLTPTREELLAGVETPGDLERAVLDAVAARFAEKRERLGDEAFAEHARLLMLRTLDEQWKDHLRSLDHLKEGIGLRGYGQRDPKMEYKRESFELFGDMKERVEDEISRLVFLVEPLTPEQRAEQEQRARDRVRRLQEAQAAAQASREQKPKRLVAADKVGRNDPCPCGSGKKYKKCCAQATA